jgi:flavin-dependent dehydrogenase
MSVSRQGVRPDFETDVCVVGGGPAGATVARRLATLGHRVSLLERAAHPNQKVGAALTPGILPLLEALGLRARVEGESFVRPTRVVNLWAEEVANVEAHTGAPGFVVDRARFDRILLDAAEEAGVKVLRPARVTRASQDDEGWNVEVRSDAGPLNVKAAFVVDATGKGSVVAGRRERHSPRTVALNAYWRGVKSDPSEVLIEAGPDEWFWGATLPDGTFNAMVFLDPARRRDSSTQNLEALYRSLLCGSKLLRRCLGGTMAGAVKGLDASSYAEAHPVGARSIKVGEAAFSIDPLSSQGVQAAVASGLQAAVVVNTILRSDADADTAAQFYLARQREAVTRHARFAAGFYSEARPRSRTQFWQSRSAAVSEFGNAESRFASAAPPHGELRLSLSGEAALVETPCVVGDFVRSVPALVHPGMGRPVAYFGGIEASKLLGSLPEAATAAEIVRAWTPRLAPREGFELVSRLYRAGVLVGAARD